MSEADMAWSSYAHCQRREALRRIVKPWDSGVIPGVAIGLVEPRGPATAEAVGFSDLRLRDPITPSTQMRVGSISKHFTAVLALRLAHAGLIDLDSSIGDFLSELSPRIRTLTLRELLRNRSGVRCHLDCADLFGNPPLLPVGTASGFQLPDAGVNGPPGSRMLYSNGGFHLASVAIETAVRTRFSELLSEWLFKPLGMEATTVVESDHARPSDLANSYQCVGETWERSLFPSEELKGEGGVVSTVNDMLRWIAFVVRDWKENLPFWHELTRRSGEADTYYGLGTVVSCGQGALVLGHSGAIAGGRSHFSVMPELGFGCIAISNGAPNCDPEELCGVMLSSLPSGFKLKEDSPQHPRSFPSDLQGKWWSAEEGLFIAIEQLGVGLHVQLFGRSPGIPLRPCDGGSLRAYSNSCGLLEVDGVSADGGDLHTRVDGRPVRFERKVATSLLPASCAGSYYCRDVRVLAEVEGVAKPRLTFSGDWGTAECEITPFGADLALLHPVDGAGHHHSAISWDGDVDPERFQLFSARTRSLSFYKVKP